MNGEGCEIFTTQNGSAIAKQNLELAKTWKKEPNAPTKVYGDLFSKPHRAHPIREASSTIATGLPDADRKSVMKSVKTAALKSSWTLQTSPRKRTPCRQSRNHMMRFYQQISYTTVTVENATPAQEVRHRLTAIEKKDRLARETYRISAQSMITFQNR